MADEARIHSTLQILKTDGNVTVIDYISRPGAFTADVTGTKGPSPGAITVTPTGTNVDLSQLTTPGLCRLMNQDTSIIITYGIWDGVTFYPLGEIWPGESYIVRLSSYLAEEFAGTSTSTTGAAINRLQLRSGHGSENCVALVECFEA